MDTGFDVALDVLFLVVALVYAAALFYFISKWRKGGKKEEKPEKKKKSSHRRRGRRCPNCKNMIDQRRTVCQHCGEKLPPFSGVEPHPEELRKLKEKNRKDQDPEKEATS